MGLVEALGFSEVLERVLKVLEHEERLSAEVEHFGLGQVSFLAGLHQAGERDDTLLVFLEPLLSDGQVHAALLVDVAQIGLGNHFL